MQHNVSMDTFSNNLSQPNELIELPSESSQKLELLLTEVSALATRLKQTFRRFQPESSLGTWGRSVLEILEAHGPQSVPQIARQRCTSRQNVQTIVNRLKAKGCVELVTNPAHRRSALVQGTDRGRSLVQASSVTKRDLTGFLSSKMTSSELDSAVLLLRRLRGLLAEHEAASDQIPARRTQGKPGPISAQVRTGDSGIAPPGAVEDDSGEIPVSLL
jgi:DNA-binding MarR family transcriptional regulator